MGRNVATSVCKAAAGAIVCGTSDLGGTLPDDLREVSPAIKSGIVIDIGWGGLAIEAIEIADLVVVEEISDDGRDVASWSTSCDVLTVASAISRPVCVLAEQTTKGALMGHLRLMSVDARASNLLSGGSKACIPRKSWSRVVGTMRIVMRNYGIAVIAWGCLTGA